MRREGGQPEDEHARTGSGDDDGQGARGGTIFTIGGAVVTTEGVGDSGATGPAFDPIGSATGRSPAEASTEEPQNTHSVEAAPIDLPQCGQFTAGSSRIMVTD